MKPQKPIELDGRTGEGGGQLVRIAAALAAVTSQPIRITHVRGNRPGPRGGGLKAQHVSSLKWLVEATGAEVEGLAVGSHTLEFRPAASPADFHGRHVRIVAESGAASTLLIFQAVFPFLLFAGNDAGEPIELEIQGGTNTSFSPSYEYLTQILLPALTTHFNIQTESHLKTRGWSLGPKSTGTIHIKMHPLSPGQPLRPQPQPQPRPQNTTNTKPSRIDASIVAPWALHKPLQEALVKDLGELFPGVDVHFVVVDDSGHETRIYTLLVAHAPPLRWGRDCLYGWSVKRKGPAQLSGEVSRQVCRELFEEVVVVGGCGSRGVVDEYLQDQLVIFQALAEGRSSFFRGEGGGEVELGEKMGAGERGGGGGDVDGLAAGVGKLDLGCGMRMRKDKTMGPLGEGSTHTTTARWVAAELLPGAKWFNKGRICEGVGVSFGQSQSNV